MRLHAHTWDLLELALAVLLALPAGYLANYFVLHPLYECIFSFTWSAHADAAIVYLNNIVLLLYVYLNQPKRLSEEALLDMQSQIDYFCRAFCSVVIALCMLSIVLNLAIEPFLYLYSAMANRLKKKLKTVVFVEE